ncbi:MAG: tetratricopeptide repeat protein [Bacteroidales bacterium]|nr:tetratricopeptide repeat protein [Bacteroidales bacterium]
MALDRFENYGIRLKELVLNFESMLSEHREQYFDSDELEHIIDFYMESTDIIMLEEALKYAEKLFPGKSSIQLRKAQLYGAIGKGDEALAILGELEMTEPNNSDVMFTLAIVCSQLGEHEKSIYYYKKSLDEGNDLGIVYENISMEYQYLGDYEQAIVYSKRALKECPNNEDSMLSISLCYEMLKRTEENVEFLKGYVQEYPYSEMGWFHLGLSYINLKLYEKGLQAFDYALAINEKSSLVHFAKANAYTMMEKYSEAISVLVEMLSFSEGKEVLFTMIGDNYFKMKNYEIAAIYFKKAAYVDPSFVDSWIKAANCYLELDDRNSALEYLGRGLEKNPKSQDMLIEAARVYMKMDEEDTVVELFEDLLKYGYGDDERTWMTFIELYIEYENYTKALDLIEQGKSYFEDQFELNLRRVLCYFKLGKKDVACDYLREYVFTFPDSPYDTILQLCPEMVDNLDVMDILHGDR